MKEEGRKLFSFERSRWIRKSFQTRHMLSCGKLEEARELLGNRRREVLRSLRFSTAGGAFKWRFTVVNGKVNGRMWDDCDFWRVEVELPWNEQLEHQEGFALNIESLITSWELKQTSLQLNLHETGELLSQTRQLLETWKT
jgi:hypothetical protein